VSNANDSIQQITDDGQQVLGVNGITEATSDINVATNLSDPDNGPLVDSNVCLNTTVLSDDDPAPANCSATPSDATTGLANVGLQTGGQSTNILGTDPDLTNNACLDAQLLTDASSNCGGSSNNGAANVGFSSSSGLNAPDVLGNTGQLAANTCVDAVIGGSDTNDCTGSSSDGLLNLGTNAGTNTTTDLLGNTGVNGNICFGAALLSSSDASCQTANNGDNGNGDTGNGNTGDNGGNNGGNTGDDGGNNGGNTGDTGGNNGGNTGDNGGNNGGNTGDNGGNTGGNTGDTGGNNGGDNGGQNGNTSDNTGGNTSENGGQGGSANGGNAAVSGGQGGSGSGGLIPVSYVPSNSGGAGSGNGGLNAPASTTSLPSLMPTTGQAQATVAASRPLDTFLLTLIGLLFLLAGSVVIRQTRFQQNQMSQEEVR
jgi:hypothetical protein